MDTSKIVHAADTLDVPFTIAAVLKALKMSDNEAHQRRVRTALRLAGFVSTRQGRQTRWSPRPPVISPGEQEQVERDAGTFAGDEPKERRFCRTSPKITVTIAGPEGAGKSRLRAMLAQSAAAYHPARVEFVEVQTDANSTTRDALDAEALAELVRRANETNEGLVRQLEEQREVTRTIQEFAYEMAGRWSSALCAGGIIDVYRVERRFHEEIRRLAAQVDKVRARHRGDPMAAREAL